MVTPFQPHLEGWDKPAVGMVEQASGAEWVLPRVEEIYQEFAGSHRWSSGTSSRVFRPSAYACCTGDARRAMLHLPQ